MSQGKFDYDIPTIKKVSRIKHQILEKYLLPWEIILGSSANKLYYFDCFAGSGTYEYEGHTVDGSPLIAVKTAKGYLREHLQKEIMLCFIDKSTEQLEQLKKSLRKVQPYGERLHVELESGESAEAVKRRLTRIRTEPSFFFVDPYNHPLTIPILNDILSVRRREILIIFMYYRINMDFSNPQSEQFINRLFGNDEWKQQKFNALRGHEREQEIVNYFKLSLNASHILQFKIRFDETDKISSKRTKYYIFHTSNHVKAALLMKEVMWPLGDEEGMFDYSGEIQGQLFSRAPVENELHDYIVNRYSGRELSFDKLREETWELPFIEKHYRNVIKKLTNSGLAKHTPVTSKTHKGLKGKDRVLIYHKNRLF